MEETRGTAYLLDIGTFEVKDTIYPGDRILRKKSTDYLSETKDHLPKELYVKAFIRPMFKLPEVLSGTEVQFVYYLLQFLEFESGVLSHPTNGKHLSREYISLDTGMGLSTVDRLLGKLKEEKVISHNHLGREVKYFMNPFIFMRGRRINKTLHEMFKNSPWAKLYEQEESRPTPRQKKMKR